jgi:hypothetical protein
MPSRVIALLFAVVLLWSGLNPIEAPRGFAQPSAEGLQASAAAGGPEAEHAGSMDQHHLDDRPWQAQSESSAEPPGLVPMPLRSVAPRAGTARPGLPHCAAVTSPFLEGPLRPPRSAALVA